MLSELSSFLVKYDLSKYPLFGIGSIFIQCLFVKRDSEEERKNIL